MHLTPEDTDLIGNWILVNSKVVGDTPCERIEWLIANSLQKVAIAEGGWSTLYRNPQDGRYWEHTYPRSEMHGGEPSRLTLLTEEQANTRYGHAISDL